MRHETVTVCELPRGKIPHFDLRPCTRTLRLIHDSAQNGTKELLYSQNWSFHLKLDPEVVCIEFALWFWKKDMVLARGGVTAPEPK
jgi:hypothetical protein